ncbi:MAG: hypothetical protein ABI623_12070 [bacterium]
MTPITQSVPTDRSIADFYDVLGSDYDTVTGIEKRFARERIQKNNDTIEHDLQSNPFRSVHFTKCNWQQHCRNADYGFRDLSFYGGIALDAFMPEISKDLVVIARKGKH